MLIDVHTGRRYVICRDTNTVYISTLFTHFTLKRGQGIGIKHTHSPKRGFSQGTKLSRRRLDSPTSTAVTERKKRR